MLGNFPLELNHYKGQGSVCLQYSDFLIETSFNVYGGKYFQSTLISIIQGNSYTTHGIKAPT